jgi:hypothetical protein
LAGYCLLFLLNVPGLALLPRSSIAVFKVETTVGGGFLLYLYGLTAPGGMTLLGVTPALTGNPRTVLLLM